MPTEIPGLRVLTSGPAVDGPSDLLACRDGQAHRPAVRRGRRGDLRRAAGDAGDRRGRVAIQVDGVLLTVAAGHTKRDDAQRAKELLEKVGARLVGAALVNVAADAELRKYLATAELYRAF